MVKSLQISSRLLLLATVIGGVLSVASLHAQTDAPVSVNPSDPNLYASGTLANAAEDPAKLRELIIRQTVVRKAHERNDKLTADELKMLADDCIYAHKHNIELKELWKDGLKRFKEAKPNDLLNISVGDLMVLSDYYSAYGPNDPHRRASIRQGEDILKQPIGKWANDDNLLFLHETMTKNLAHPATRAAVKDSLTALNNDVPPGSPDRLYEVKNPRAANSHAVQLAKRHADAAAKGTERLNERVTAARKEIAQMRKEILKRLEERTKAGVALQVTIRATKTEEERHHAVDANLVAMRMAVSTLRALDPKNRELSAFCVVCNAQIEISSFLQRKAGGLFSSPANFLSVYGIVFNAAQALFSLFGGGPSELQLVMEQIQALRDQVRELHLDMRRQFRGLEGQLDRMQILIEDRFDHLERLTRVEFDGVRERLRQGDATGQRILAAIAEANDQGRHNARSQEARLSEKAATTLECRALTELFQKGVLLSDEQLERYLPQFEFGQAMDRLYNGATKFARDRLATGHELNGVRLEGDAEQDAELRRALNWRLAQRLSVHSPQHEVRVLFDAAKILGLPARLPARAAPGRPAFDDPFPIGSAYDWSTHARTFLAFARQWSEPPYPAYYSRYDPELSKLGDILNAGRATREAIQGLLPLDVDGRPDARTLFRLLVNYEAELLELRAEIERRKQNLRKQGATVKGYDPFAPFETWKPRPEAVTLPHVFPRGAIPAAPEYRPVDEKKRPKDIPDLAVARDQFERYRVLIPAEFQIARDLLGGTIEVCHEKAGAMPVEGHNHDELGFVLRATYRHDTVGHLPIFRKKVVGAEGVTRLKDNGQEKEAVDLWYGEGRPLEERLLTGKTVELLDNQVREWSRAMARLRVEEFVGAEVRRFADEEIRKDAEGQAGKLGDKLHAVEGARLILVNLLQLCLGQALEREPAFHLHLLALRGENRLALDLAQFPARYLDPKQQEATFQQLLEPGRALLAYLLTERPDRARRTRVLHLEDTLDQLEAFYMVEAVRRGRGVLPASMRAVPENLHRVSSAEINQLAAWLLQDPRGPRLSARDALRLIEGYASRENPTEARWREIRRTEIPERYELMQTIELRRSRLHDGAKKAAALREALSKRVLSPEQYKELGLQPGTAIYNVDPIKYLKLPEAPTFVSVATEDEMARLRVLPPFLDPTAFDASKVNTYKAAASTFHREAFLKEVGDKKAACDAELGRKRFNPGKKVNMIAGVSPTGTAEVPNPFVEGSLLDNLAFVEKQRSFIAEHERFGPTSITRNWRAREKEILTAIEKVRKDHGAYNVLK